jgi:hypothetical protein
MITAMQANELREKAIELEIAEKRERTDKFCEELGFVIERRAKEKYSMVTTEVANDIRNYAVHALAENGYKVTINTDNTITVMW